MISAPPETYLKMISYGEKKSASRSDQLALQSFISGYWIALYGHALTDFSGSFYKTGDPVASGIAKGLYGLLFPGAFVALIYTGAELYTGNTVTMVMLVLHHGKKALKDLIRVWLISLIGNFVGVTFGAFFFTYLARTFSNGSTGQVYLHSLAQTKISRDWGANLILAVGCNSLVCLATWCSICSEDGAGKILAIFYTIGIFIVGGFEHVIFNMYLLSAAIFTGLPNFSYAQAWYRNFIPVFLGNMIAGIFLTGIMWWYALHPRYTDLAPYSDLELMRELTSRYRKKSEASPDDEKTEPIELSLVKDSTVSKQDQLWKRGASKKASVKNWIKSALLPPHFQPKDNFENLSETKSESKNVSLDI